jgi:hypothetical protein
MKYEDLTQALADPNADGTPARIAKSLDELQIALGDRFTSLIELSKEQAAVLDVPADRFDKLDWDMIKQYGLLGMFHDGFFFVWRSSDACEVHCYFATGNGGYGGHMYVFENGQWRDLEEE